MNRRSTVLRTLLMQPIAVVAVLWLLLVAIVTIAPSLVTSQDPLAQDVINAYKAPSGAHLFGTDQLGRDVFSRLVHGGGVTFTGVIVSLITWLIVGVVLGLLSGYRGGGTDAGISRFAELLMAVPGLVVLLVVGSIFGGLVIPMVVLGVIASGGLIRLVRAATLAAREELFVSAARISGLSHLQILTRHILPRIRGLVVVQAFLFAAVSLVASSGLTFLGIGVQPPNPSWGGLMAEASQAQSIAPWFLVYVGAVFALTVLALGLLGNSVSDVLAAQSAQPRLARRVRSRKREVMTAVMPDAEAVLSVHGLSVDIPISTGGIRVVDGVDFAVRRGETVGLVGESGSGKTMTALGILGLVPGGGTPSGYAFVDGTDLVSASETERSRLRGRKIAYIAQDPMTALDPTFTVGNLLTEAVRRNAGGDRRAAQARVIDLLIRVHLPEPEEIARRYPHQLSGGMAQRVVIALALAGNPDVLIADEPTTALDVTVQAEILALLRELQSANGMAIVLITHDWGVVADMCDRAVVMYAGQVVEQGNIRALFREPVHPYTAALLESVPERTTAHGPLPSIPGTVPRPSDWPVSCHFAARCPLAVDACTAGPIPLIEVEPGRPSRCIRTEVLLEVEHREGALL